MANVTGSNDSFLKGHSYDPTCIVISFIIGTMGIILNSTEFHLIRQKWKKATDFEVLLLNLGITDLLSAIGLLAMVSVDTVMYVHEASRKVGYLLVAMGIVGYFSAVSMKLVIAIGIERLFAIKLSLKRRLWHTNRKTLYKRISAAWLLAFIFNASAYLFDCLIQKSKGRSATISFNLAYELAVYLTLGACTVLVTYAWLSRLVINREIKILKFDTMDYKKNPKVIRKAVRKENATIIICRLVAATYLVCNIPAIVGLYRGQMDNVSVTLFNLNSVINPLIYFFKGYVEKQYAKKKLPVSSSEAGGSDNASTKVTKSESSLEISESNKANEDKLPKLTGKDSGSSGDKGNSPSPKTTKADSSLESEDPNTKRNENLKPSGEEAKALHGRGQASVVKVDLSLKMTLVNEESRKSRYGGEEHPNKFDSENGDTSAANDKKSENLKFKIDEALNKQLDLLENDPRMTKNQKVQTTEVKDKMQSPKES